MRPPQCRRDVDPPSVPNAPWSSLPSTRFPRGYHAASVAKLSGTAKTSYFLRKCADVRGVASAGEAMLVPVHPSLGVYGGAPTPAIECVPQGVRSTMRAGALR